MLRIGMCAAALIVGCGPDEDSDPCDWRVCDIEDEACVEAVAETVACQREVDLVVPEVRFVSSDEVLAEWNAEPPTPEEIEQQRQYIAAEALVGLMPAVYEPTQSTADQIENIAAYYSRDGSGITIITDNNLDDPIDAYALLVHEMVHVSQDAIWDLDALSEAHATTGDRFLGLRAAIEGDASLYGNLATLALLGLSPDAVNWGAYFTDFQGAMLEIAATTDTPSVDALSLFPYAWGEAYVYPAWSRLDTAGPESVANDPPDSVRQVMRGYPGEARADINEDALLDPFAVPMMPGFAFVGGDHYSVWLLNAMLQRTIAGTPSFAAELDGVSADYLTALRHEESGVPALVWRIRGGTSLANLLELPTSSWTSTNAGEQQRSWHVVDGDIVLVAVGEGLESTAVFETVEGWQTPQLAYEAAGLDGSPRPHPTAITCKFHR
jgi:hypothetical protein